MVGKVERGSWRFVVGILVVLGGSGGATPLFGQTGPVQGLEPRLSLTIQVCSNTRISKQTLDEAKEEAGRILRQSEVETVWLDCRPEGEKAQTQPDASQATRQYFSLVILKQALPERRLHDETLGFAVPCPELDGPCRAFVFYPRVRLLAAESNVSTNLILGHVMAHELGHLLLGSYHAPAGIMQAKWDGRDLQRASWKILGFTPQQRELIRAKIRMREGAAQVSSR